MRRVIAPFLAVYLLPVLAFAQSAPNWPLGYKPTIAEINAQFARKLDTTGGTFSGAVAATSLTVSGASTLAGAFTVNANAAFNGTLGVAGTSTLATLGVTGAATVGGTLGVTGALTVGSTLGVTGAVTLGGSVTPSQTAGIVGTTTNNNVAAGAVGEFISSTVLVGGAVPLSTGVAANVASISLTAGDWDVRGNIVTVNPGTTVTSLAAGAISPTSATLPTLPNGGAYAQVGPGSTAGTVQSLPTGTMRVSIAAPATYYLVTSANFSVSTLSAYGFIGARRVR